MSRELRPVCPLCAKALVQQPSIKSWRCEPCKRTFTDKDARSYKRIEIETVP